MKTKSIKIAGMKNFILSLLALGVSGIATAQNIPWYQAPDAASRGAFGPDTRAEAKTKWAYKDYMRATATAVQSKNVQGDKVYCGTLERYIKRAFGDYPIDASVRFLDQPTAGFCTGFLIAPDILVTAGHCIETNEDLKNTIWVFDYTSDISFNKSGGYVSIPQSNQYRGVELLATKLTDDNMYDYCVIRLDRKTNRKPYKFRTSGAVEFDDFLAMIGSPSGLPLKVADSARVTNNEDYSTSFLTDLDAFHGNSGGPVFNTNGYIEGILVRGPGWDFHYDEESGTIKQDVHYDLFSLFGMQALKGNAVHRINHIPTDLLIGALYRNLEVAITDNDATEFSEWSVYSWMFSDQYQVSGKENLIALAANYNRGDMLNSILDMEGININSKDKYNTPVIHLMARNNMSSSLAKLASKEGADLNIRDANGETALMIAAKNGNADAVQALINAGADVKAVNFQGKTARKIAKSAKQKAIAKMLKKAEKGKK